MDDVLTRFAEGVTARITGPMKFRLLLQPAMAAFFAIRAGLNDARRGSSPYLSTFFSDLAERADLVENAWKDIGKVFILATVLDAVYQFIVSRWIYPGEAILVAVILALVPYLILRGTVTRIVRRKIRNNLR
jgi:hypothetical protein